VVKFEIINIDVAYESFDSSRISLNWLDSYLSSRPDVLTNIDFFMPGERSSNQVYTRFDLFERNSKNPDVMVSPLYLELFEFSGIGDQIVPYVQNLCNRYKDHLVVFQWNHDNDFSEYSNQIDNIPNARIINLGDSAVVGKNDILVHRWAINTKKYSEPKTRFSCFIGSINNAFRYNLMQSIITRNDPNLIYMSNIPHEEYLKTMSSSLFSLCPMGGPGRGGFSYRFFECLHLNTIPVLMVDNIIFPYTHIVDWSKLCIKINQQDSLNLDFLLERMQKSDSDEMLNYINETRLVFTLGGAQEEIYKRLSS